MTDDSLRTAALALPAIDPALPFEIYKWAETINAHCHTYLQDHEQPSHEVDTFACIMMNVRDLLKAVAQLDGG